MQELNQEIKKTLGYWRNTSKLQHDFDLSHIFIVFFPFILLLSLWAEGLKSWRFSGSCTLSNFWLKFLPKVMVSWRTALFWWALFSKKQKIHEFSIGYWIPLMQNTTKTRLLKLRKNNSISETPEGGERDGNWWKLSCKFCVMVKYVKCPRGPGQ